jgi:uncharacterized Zn finger protein
MPLKNLTIRKARSLAGGRWFARGEAYFEQGRVSGLNEQRGKIAAFVEGTQNYRVKLWDDGAALGYSCTCPLGDDFEFCKHCVAVALAWLETPAVSPKSANAETSDLELLSFLEQQDKGKLIELVLLEASENPRLRDRLTLEAARLSSSGINLSVFRKSIAAALRTAGIDYYSMPRYARRVQQVIDSVAALLNDGHAQAVVKLTEFALAKLEKAIGEVDDSDGHMGEIVASVEELHLEACKLAHEESAVLARRLFERELTSGWDIFSGAAETYAEVLGSRGLEQYRLLAEAEWSQVPALEPGFSRKRAIDGMLNEKEAQASLKRFRITSIMESLARQAGDYEALVAIKRRDLSHPYAYLEIATIYREAVQHDKALEWAEQGVRAFSHSDSRLTDFLADEYHRLGRHAEAMEPIWAAFIEVPRLDTYKKLHAHALLMSDNLQIVVTGKKSSFERNDSTNVTRVSSRRQAIVRRAEPENAEWLAWRAKALTHLRTVIVSEKLAAKPAQAYGSWRREVDHSELVEIFLWEKDYEEAWQEAAAGGCADYLLLRLADATAKEHPERSLPVYKELIAPTLSQTNNAAYDEAIKLLHKVRQVMSDLNRQSEFDDYLIALRVEYKRKRNFIKLLDGMWQER